MTAKDLIADFNSTKIIKELLENSMVLSPAITRFSNLLF